MKNKKFHNHKVGHKHEIKLRNIVVIFLSILIGLGSIVVFAQQGSVLNISTDLNNAVQTIKRIIISTDGTDTESNKLFDLNTDGVGSSKIYTTRFSSSMNPDVTRAEQNTRKVLGVDGNDNLIFLPNGAFSGAGGTNGNGNGGGDNLGNHTATGNLNMNGFWISRDGTDKGIQLQSDHKVKISSLASNPGKCVMVDADGILGLTTCGSGSSAGAGNNGIDGAQGPAGTGILSIALSGTRNSNSSAINTYVVTYSAGLPYIFNLKNGARGATGEKGDDGDDGADGFLQAGIQGATPFRSGTSRITNNVNIFNKGNYVGIGFPAGSTLHTKLDVNGMIKISDSSPSTECNADMEGSMRYKSNCFQGCDGINRVDLGGLGCNTVTNYQCMGTRPANSIDTHIGAIPANTSWYYSGTAGACTYECKTNYIRDPINNICETGTQIVNCVGLPTNAIRFDVPSSIEQTWNGSQRDPSNIGTYFDGYPSCDFFCDIGYIRNSTNETCDIDPGQGFSCLGTLQTGAISNGSDPTASDTGRTYNITPGICTYECDTDYIRNTGTQYCCNIPDNSTLYQSGTTTVQSLRGSAIRGTSLRGVNTTNNTGIIYQNGNCNFTCDTGFARNGDLINPSCDSIIAPTCGRGFTSWGSTDCLRGQ
ncbi:hypothetical protein K9M48_01210 [Candidatus Gracilibacteria bacterium]|nr:hypothetical protein [Candidatus Gracilibacteria bacterium]